MSDWLDSLSWYLMRRRLTAEASASWVGSPCRKLDRNALTPVIKVLLQLAEPAMYHKNGGLRSASLEVLSNAVYLQPDLILPVVVRRFQEALAASNSVHQISSSIRALSGTLLRLPALYCLHFSICVHSSGHPEESAAAVAYLLELVRARNGVCMASH